MMVFPDLQEAVYDAAPDENLKYPRQWDQLGLFPYIHLPIFACNICMLLDHEALTMLKG